MTVSTHPPGHTRAWIELVLGVVMLVGGIALTVKTMVDPEASGGRYVIAVGPILAGLVLMVRAVSDLAGYRSFVAWRYLLVAHPKVTRTTKILIAIAVVARMVFWLGGGVALQPQVTWSDPMHIGAAASSLFFTGVVFWGVLRHSKPAMVVFVLGAALIGISQLGTFLVSSGNLPFITFEAEQKRFVLQILGFVGIGGGVFAGLATFFGSLRAFFTFFTTVPIGGVWIGTAALVCVLAVMSGFESDLRDKILGSNAHIQITREDGEFINWLEIKQRIDNIPGVVASTPYAVSEVVIAAHNNGMNVIIKGIDPATVGQVTDLVSDLEDREAINRLEPLVDNTRDLSVPQTPQPTDVLDPPPEDLPSRGDPIDFSAPDEPSLPLPDAGFGGDAIDLIGPDGVLGPDGADDIDEAAAAPPVLDPPPDDLIATDAPPEDFSEPDLDDDSAIGAGDIPLEPVSRRTQALPGVLVGRELVKQTHLYTGEEVRVVSPLSDPSNPDATGTPIPFNRDYRVAGIFYTGMYEYDLKYVYVTLESLQDFLDRGDAIDGIEVRITDADDTERYIPTSAGPGLIRQALGPSYRVVDWRELNRSLFSALKLEKIAMFLVLGIVILVASFSIVGNLVMVVVEKAREIALLKTLGASNFGVMQLFAIQGMMIGLIGTVLGVATGLLGCWAGAKFGLPLNPDVYYIDRLPIHVDPQSVAAAAAAGVCISILATLYPALLAAQVRPAAGMRH